MRQIPIYWINLASRPDRKAFMEEQFDRLGLKAERIEAVTRADLSYQQIDRYCNPNRRWSMTESRYACNQSHMRAWNTLTKAGHSRALILEDDAALSPSLPGFLAALASSTDKIDIIRIEASWGSKRRFRAPDIRVMPDVALRECLSRDIGAAGYVMRSDAAERLATEPSFHTSLVDDFLFSPFSRVGWGLSVRYSDPALCHQIGYGAELTTGSSSLNGPEDAAHKLARKRHPLTKFSRHLEIWLAKDIPWWLTETAFSAVSHATRTALAFKAD